MLRYITNVTAGKGENQSWVEEQILEANTVLESFGNAKTTRNNNSSRFGRFIKVSFNLNMKIIGAEISNYLLEKSRVVRQSSSERNYHIFYEMLAGAKPDEKKKYKLPESAQDFYYLNQSGCIEIPGVDDKKNFESLRLALTVLKMSSTELDELFRVISGILHLGNVSFTTSDDSQDGASIESKSDPSISALTELFACDEGDIRNSLKNRQIFVRNEMTNVPLKKEQAEDNRDSIAKAIYDKLFNYIVAFINKSTLAKDKVANFIGILDIFGFEKFEKNSFEQLCINYTNEKLQQFFNQFIFKLEQEEYKKEDISWNAVDFVDNQMCIDLIEQKPGILAFLDEECKLPKGTDKGFLSKIHDFGSANKYYKKPRTAVEVFGILHYAGEVTYDVEGFLEKNRDSIQDGVYGLFQKSKNSLLAHLFETAESKNEKGQKKSVTAGSNFKTQLLSLITTLNTASPHYVRCIKPNYEKKAFSFDPELTLAQLKYAGMLETIRIRKAGFPSRFTFEQFSMRFRFLSEGRNDAKEAVGAIFQNTKIDSSLWRVGKTKVFMKQEVLDLLVEETNKLKEGYIIVIQNLWRTRAARKHFLRVLISVKYLQSYIKMFAYRQQYLRKKKAILKMQSVVRGWFARDYCRQMKKKLEESSRAAKKAEEERLKAEKKKEVERIKAAKKAEVAKLKEEKRKQLVEKKKKAKSKGKKADDSADQKSEEPEPEPEPTEEEEAEIERQIREEEKKKLAEYNAQRAKDGGKKLDNMFSFIGNYDGKQGDQLGELGAQLADDMGDIFELEEAPIEISRKKKSSPTPEPQVDVRADRFMEMRHRALKFNPLAKGLAEEDKDEKSIQLFAEKHFQLHPRVAPNMSVATFRKVKETQTIEEMLMFTRAPIPTTMIKLDVPESIIEIGVRAFKTLKKAIDPTISETDDAVSAIKDLISVGITHPELRDELFVQLIRQMNQNPDAEVKDWGKTLLNGWGLMAIYCSCFAPSKALSKYLLKFLSSFSEHNEDYYDKSPVAKLAVYSEDSVRQVLLNGPRKLVPSADEIRSLRKNKPTLCRFFLYDGQIKAFPVFATTTAANIVKDLAEKIDLKDHHGWSLCEVSVDNWEERFVKGTEYVSDIISSWEQKNLNSSKKSDFTTVKTRSFFPFGLKTSSKPARPAVGEGESRLYLRKKVFKNVGEVPADPVEFNLIYAQGAMDVHHDMFPMTEKMAAQFAALKAQTDWGDYDPQKNARFEELEKFIPRNLYGNQTKESWIKAISEFQQRLVGKTGIQAKLLYLESLKQFKHYGSTLFPVRHIGFWQHPSNVVLAISGNAVFLMTKSKNIIETYSYKQIHSWETESDAITLNFFTSSTEDKENNSGKNIESLKFETKAPEDIGSLLKEYSLKVGADRKKERELFVTENEMKNFVKDLTKARLNVLKKNIINFGSDIPNNPEQNSKEWDSLVLNLSAPIVKSQESSEFKTSPEDLHVAIMDFVTTKDISNKKAGKKAPKLTPEWQKIREILDLVKEEPKLIDELYMKLVNLTSDMYEPGSQGSIKSWKLLSVAIGLFKPSFSELSELIRSHSRKHSVIQDNLTKNQMRKEEQIFAQYCSKQFSKSLKAEVRKILPGEHEIKCTSRPGPINARVYMPDKQYRAIAFNPHTTVEDLKVVLLEKLNLGNSGGYAVYSKDNRGEKNLKNTQNLADLLGQWFIDSQNEDDNEVPQLLMKKRLFLDPKTVSKSEVEEEFYLMQIIQEIVAGRYPLSRDDAVYLAGLRAQAETGDEHPEKSHVHKDIMEKFVPEPLRSDQLLVLIQREHSSFRKKNPQDCRRLFMARARSWSLFGSTVFEVVQNYTSEFPNECWLLVHHEGIHLNARQSKDPLVSLKFGEIGSVSTDTNSLMILSSDRSKRIVLETTDAEEIGSLINDYQNK